MSSDLTLPSVFFASLTPHQVTSIDALLNPEQQAVFRQYTAKKLYADALKEAKAAKAAPKAETK